ncbi:MAG: PRC-barrel domain-containing protein [Planctomycetes bacterium]|nr:PRC-barrel domain-containing protein [Planctomycetota bacterium]
MRHLAAVLAGGAVLAWAAFAVQAEDREKKAQERNTNVEGKAGVEIRAEGERRPGDSQFYKASEIIGTTVKGQDGQALGRVKDLMIDARSEEVRYLILEGETALKAEGKLFVMPWVVAEPHHGRTAADRYLTVGIERQRLMQAPTIGVTDFRSLNDVSWTTRVDTFYKADADRRRKVLRPNLDDEGRPGLNREGDDRPSTRPRNRGDRDDAAPGTTKPGTGPRPNSGAGNRDADRPDATTPARPRSNN